MFHRSHCMAARGGSLMLLLMLHPAKSYHKPPGPVQHRLLYRGLGNQKKHAGQTLNQSMNRFIPFNKTQRQSVYWSHNSETTRFNWSVSINKRQQQHPVDERTHWSFSRGSFFDGLLLFLKLSKHLQVRAITLNG